MIKEWISNRFKKKKSADVDLNIVKNAIHDYRKVGKELMHKLGQKFNLNIEIQEDYEKLISKSNNEIPRRGELSKKWNYSFHGGECGFYNKKYKQQVEVVLANSPEFGQVDSWFLLSYMQSTTKYKNEITGVDWQVLQLLIEKLYVSGEVLEVVE